MRILEEFWYSNIRQTKCDRCGNLGDWEELSEVEKVEDNGALT